MEREAGQQAKSRCRIDREAPERLREARIYVGGFIAVPLDGAEKASTMKP